MGSAIAETQMNIGVHLRTQVIDSAGSPAEVVQTNGSLRANAVNLGVISFYVELYTDVVGDSVTNERHATSWSVNLLLAGSTGAKTGGQADTKLIVTQPDSMVAFRTVARLDRLVPGENPYTETGHHTSETLDIIAKTA